jgi:hypothetical protein
MEYGSEESYDEFKEEVDDYLETSKSNLSDENHHDEKFQKIPHQQLNVDSLVQLEKGICFALVTYLVLVILIKVKSFSLAFHFSLRKLLT